MKIFLLKRVPTSTMTRKILKYLVTSFCREEFDLYINEAFRIKQSQER